jgi:major membrane immunogen (membrane-anchored lipoprotein)
MRYLSLVLPIAAILLLIGCGQEEEAEEAAAEYEDGVYFAQADEFSPDSGWKDVVVIEVEAGEISSVEWNAAHRDNGTAKYKRSVDGEYGMVARGDAMAPWYEQADAVASWLVENQDPAQLELDDEARPEAISGASIHSDGFKSLAQESLAAGPVGYGMYEDGSWSASHDEFGDNGWKATVSLTVIGGRIVAAEWDEVNEDGEMKAALSTEGEYGMVENGGAMAPWHEQANAAERWLLENQDPNELDLNDEGRADAISGASIDLDGFKELAIVALEGHRR